MAPREWIDRLHPDDRERVAAALAGRPEGRSLAVEYRWQCADGQYRHFLDQAVLLKDGDGNPIEYAGTLLDVSDRKELESQLVQAQTEIRTFGILGEPRVNVLRLNMALDALKPK